jgi:ribosomal protein S18 acetylase RimI-like enzyme
MLVIRKIEKGDYAGWVPLWDGNNLGVRDDSVTALTWARLNDPSFPMKGLIAIEDNKPTGLLHYVTHPTTGSVKDVCYMQDVYVAEHARKRGIAKALVRELTRRAQTQENWARIYWLADGSNEAAQKLYKNLGVKLDFSLHIMPLST